MLQEKRSHYKIIVYPLNEYALDTTSKKYYYENIHKSHGNVGDAIAIDLSINLQIFPAIAL
ncbi:hypothetical protein H1Q63_33180 [Desmonostoc muscorum CCALA 125]|nr:hypothetical protein [Desmonostoc muscorum CCALA 125]